MQLKRQQITATLTQFYSHPVAQVSLELFLSIGAVIFFATFAIRPTLLTMSDLIKEIEEKEKLSDQLTQKIAALSTAQSEYLAMEPRLTVLDEAIPPAPQLLTTLKIIEKIASDRNLVILSITTPEIPVETPAVSSGTLQRKNLPLTLSVTGDYPSIRQLVEDIQNTRRSLVIDSITFTTGEERGRKKLRAAITINVPYFAN